MRTSVVLRSLSAALVMLSGASLIPVAGPVGTVALASNPPAAVHAVQGVRAASISKMNVAVKDCGLGPRLVRPKTLILACADANAQGVRLVWSNWGQAKTTAKGTYTWNICVPYCAASNKWDNAAATFTLGKPVHTKTGWLYETLTVNITGSVPKDIQRTQVFSEKPVS